MGRFEVWLWGPGKVQIMVCMWTAALSLGRGVRTRFILQTYSLYNIFGWERGTRNSFFYFAEPSLQAFARKPWLTVYRAHTGSSKWLVETASLNGLSYSSIVLPGGANL